ncbi:MAG TPA: hypothetical protein VJ548_11360, partial [Azospira sp.]|nr:hypothetical protein [Azospira sp.]
PALSQANQRSKLESVPLASAMMCGKAVFRRRGRQGCRWADREAQVWMFFPWGVWGEFGQLFAISAIA